MPVIEKTEAVEADDAQTDWVEQMGWAAERVMDLSETLAEDKLLMPAARHLLEIAEVFPPGLSRRVFESIASCLVLEAAQRQRKARPGRR